MADLKLSLLITADGKVAVQGVREVNTEIGKTGQAAKQAAAESESGFKRINDGAISVGRSLGALLGISFGAHLVKEAVMAGDAYNSIQARLKDATRAQVDYNTTASAVYDIAQRTGTALETQVGLYQNIARSAKELGATQPAILQVQETIAQLGAISGTSTANLSAGLLQFGQAMSAGIVRAEEFNSIVENIPALAQAIADGMGMTVGQLRAAVLEGKVLSKDVFAAIQSQSGDVNQRFRELPLSISRATTELDNAWLLFMGNLIKSTGLAEGLASTLKSTADILAEWGQALDPAKQGLAEAESQIIRISERLRESEGQGLLYKWLHGSNDDMRAELNASINDLIALQDQASAFGSKGAAAFNAVSNAAQGTKAAVSDVMRSVMDLNAELRIQLAMGDQSRAHMQAYRNEAKLQTEIDKALAEGKDDVAFALEEERAGVMAVNAENIRLQGTLDAQKEAHKAATVHTRSHSTAKRELAKETRDYAREADHAIDYIERENAAIMETSERLLKLASEYGNSDAKAILYQRQVEEVTRALEAMGATSEEIRAAQQRLWEDMTSEGQAAVKLREAHERAAKEAADASQKSADEIERTITDALMRGFESGKGFAENLVATLKNMFNTLVLRPIIQAIVQPVAGAVAGMMPNVSSASTSDGDGDLLSTASNLYSVGSSIWNGIGNAATSVMTGAVVSGFTTGLDIAMANIGAAGYFGAFTTTMSTAISSAASGAVGTAVGAAIPYIGWIIAAVALIAQFIGSNKDTSPDLTLIQGAHRMDPTQGTQFQDTGSDKNNLAGFISDAFGGFFIGTQHADLTAEAKQQLQAMFTAYGQAFDTIAGLISDEMVDAATQALENLKKQNPERPSAWDDGMSKFFHDRFDILFSTIGGDLEALYNQLLGDVDFGNAADVVQLSNSIAAISTATGDFKTVLDSLLDPTITNAQAISDLSAKDEIWAATLVRLGAEVVGVNGIMDALGVALLPLDIVGAQAADALIQLAGGMENLTNASTYFFEHFYTEAEQQQRIVETTGQVIAAFNEQFRDTITASGAVTDGVIDTKEELRAFVESLDLTTEAGQQAFLAAMTLAPTLVANADALEQLANAAGQAGQAISDAATMMRDADVGGNLVGGKGGGSEPSTWGPSGASGAGSGVPDIGGWQPWHDVGPSTGAGGGTGGGATAGQTLEAFLAGIQNAIDQMTLSEYELALKAIAADMAKLRAEAEALGYGPEADAAIDQLEALRLAQAEAAESARLEADAQRLAAAAAAEAAGIAERAGRLGDIMSGVADGLDQLQLSDSEYQLKRLAIEFAAMRAEAEALGASAEDLALIDELRALREAEIAAAEAARLAQEQAEAQAEAERQARQQAEAAYEALAEAERQAQDELNTLAEEMERFNQAVQSVRDGIAGAVLSILRDQPGWSEADYQRQRIADLRRRIDQTSGLEQIALVKELQEAILARYQAERDELESVTTTQTDLYTAMDEAHRAELAHYEDVQAALKDIAKYVDSLKLDANLSPLTPRQQLEEAQRQFYDLLALAQTGDAEALRGLTGSASAYLGEARGYYASGDQYQAIFGAVTAALEALTGMSLQQPQSESEWRDFMASLQSTQTEAVVDLSGIQDQALTELQALEELLNVLAGEQALAAQEQQAAILATLQESRDTFANFAGEMPEDLAQAADEISAATDDAATRITDAITGAITAMDSHLQDTNAQVAQNSSAIASMQVQLASLASQLAAAQNALAAANAALAAAQVNTDSNTANLA